MYSKHIDGFGLYLQTMGRRNLLTHDEEIELARQIQRWMAIEEGRDEGQYSEVELKRIERNAVRAKQKLIECNQRLVVKIAKRYHDRGLPIDVLCQEGTIGLNRAAEKFDPTKGYKFSTYAYAWIRQGITRAIANDARIVRIPIHITESLNKIKKQVKIFCSENGRFPAQQELADRLGMTIEQLGQFYAYKKHACSLNKFVGDNQDTELIDLLESPESDVFDEVAAENTREVLYSVMRDHLTEKEFEVISMRFGFNGEPMALHQIGHFMGISRERVRQVERVAINKLRKTEVAKQLSGLIDRSSAK